jgi:hypothetical protein
MYIYEEEYASKEREEKRTSLSQREGAKNLSLSLYLLSLLLTSSHSLTLPCSPSL